MAVFGCNTITTIGTTFANTCLDYSALTCSHYHHQPKPTQGQFSEPGFSVGLSFSVGVGVIGVGVGVGIAGHFGLRVGVSVGVSVGADVGVRIGIGGGVGLTVAIGSIVGVAVGVCASVTVNKTVDVTPLPIESCTVTVYTPALKVAGTVAVIVLESTNTTCNGTPIVRAVEVVKLFPLTSTGMAIP